MRIDLKTGLKKSVAPEKNFKKSIDRSKEDRLNGQPFQIQTSGFERGGEDERKEVLWKSKKLFLKKIKNFEKSIDNRKENRLNGQPFQIQTSGFERRREWEREKFFEIY